MSYDAGAMALGGPLFTTQVVTPSTGTTVISDGSNGLFINNAGLIAAITITFPSSPLNGQQFAISSRSAITVMSFSPGSTIYGTLGGLIAGGFGRWVYSSTASAWFRTG